MIQTKRLAAIVATLLLAVSAVLAQGSGGAKGKVRNMRGDSLAGVKIEARVEGKVVKTATSDSKGFFEIKGLEPGTYNFAFDKEGYQLGIKFGVKVEGGKTVNLGDNLALSPDQGNNLVVSGSVFNQAGRSVTGAKIEVERVNDDGSTKRLTTTYSNAMGEFSFRQPGGGIQTLRFTASLKGVKATKDLKTEGAVVYRIALTLELPVETPDK